MASHSLPLSQIAISSIDIRRSDTWWRQGLGFLPSGYTRMFRGPILGGVVGLPGAAATTRWLVGQDDWLQIELWQYEKPMARLQAPDYAPNHVGFSRCGVWVKNFDDTLVRLAELGSTPLSDALGEAGERRICVRDPDGIYVELFEKDPLQTEVSHGRFIANAAFRSITITTEDLVSSTQFAEQGLGLKKAPFPLHDDNHETLWGLDNVDCGRETYISNSMLLEYVEYRTPSTQPRHPHSKLNDQGILNVAFGDSKNAVGIKRMCKQTCKAGAIPSSWIRSPFGGCVYMTDPLGFSFEFMWARPGMGHKLTGFLPVKKIKYSAADNHRVENSITIDFDPNTVFNFLADHDAMSDWAGLGKIETLSKGFNNDGGLGSTRLVTTPLFTITEQVTVWKVGEEIRYRILSGGPFNNYSGEVKLRSINGKTQVIWVNRFRAKVPGLGLLMKMVLNVKFKKALKNLKATMEKIK